MMSVYSQMTDDELMLEIAVRRGMKTFGADSGWFDDPEIGPREETWVVWIDGDGNRHRIPNWSTDLNAAAELLKAMIYFTLVWSYTRQAWLCSGAEDGAAHIEPSRAIAEAYAQYTDLYPTPAMLASTRDHTPGGA